MCSPEVNRWFYRCRDCLSVAAANHAPVIGMNGFGTEVCGLCSGSMECMGRVERDRLVKDTERCACDERCTSAKGPNCNCKCGGVNHGKNVTVAVRVDQGSAPVLCVPDSAKARAVAAEWTGALAGVVEAWRSLNDRKLAGWIPGSDFDRLCTLGRVLTRARSSKTHAGRMKLLGSVSVLA